jgi:hypothetical protein
VSTDTTPHKRPWWQRGPVTALWLTLLLTTLAHAKPLIDSSLATEETHAALRALATQFTILAGVMSVFFWLGTVPHKGNRSQLSMPATAGIETADLGSQTDSPANRDRWSRLEGYKLASGVGFSLGSATVGLYLAPNAIADGRITILELGLATLVILAVLWATLSIGALFELRHDASLQSLVYYSPDPRRGRLLAFYALLVGALMGGAELVPESLAYLGRRFVTLLRRLTRRPTAA